MFSASILSILASEDRAGSSPLKVPSIMNEYFRTPAEPYPAPIKEPPIPLENPDAPVREPDPEDPAQI
jgi:hypothetical protein